MFYHKAQLSILFRNVVLNDDAFYEMQRSGNHWGSPVGIIECVWFRSGIQTVSDMLCHFMNWRGLETSLGSNSQNH